MKVLIVDDEKHAQDTLEILLKKNFPSQFQIVGKCYSLDEALTHLREVGHPDLVFLDVQMPHRSGFELFQEVPHRDFEIIFTTAHDMTREAINLRPFGYLHKPINQYLLKSKVEEFIEYHDEVNINRKLDSLIGNSESLELQLFSTNDCIEFVHNDEVAYMKGDRGYTTIFKTDGTDLMVSKNLKAVLENYPEKQFLRVSKSLALNIKNVVRYDKKQNKLYLKDGLTLDPGTNTIKNIKV
ncbi:response regulator transcription factor [Litoribacter ruber]|uniref:Response regulator transcription factor n=1 Tax=Litoribacter ruber TaxID=702568 RepID=A0AAP2CN36_9BACT|nr:MULTISPECIES: LytTR family DNA-binding domain-containing protein [Litoribacter]MBS9525585.1 response regulator transcription factor [Litoribacter alkaliphilus]MBT0813125.1 response regulator transcription factor [Litoribacter ruber]